MSNLEKAYGYLLKDDLKGAARCFAKLAGYDIRAKWGLFLTDLLRGRFERYPSYFEIRSFLEIDIQMLIDSYKGDYVEKIVGCSDFFFQINQETYKFIARVFVNNDMAEQAKFFLDKAKSSFYNDPELHQIIASVYLADGKPDIALKAALDCLNIAPEYYPAKHLIASLQ